MKFFFNIIFKKYSCLEKVNVFQSLLILTALKMPISFLEILMAG